MKPLHDRRYVLEASLDTLALPQDIHWPMSASGTLAFAMFYIAVVL